MRLRGPGDDEMIVERRQDEMNVDAAQGGDLERGQDLVVRHEIGRGDPDRILCQIDRRQQDQHELVDLLIRPGHDRARRALPLGDYSVSGMENTCVVERKDLADLIQSFTTNRAVFINRLRRMADLPHSLLVVTASLTEIKSEYPYRAANPNRITQSLIAVLAGLRLPFICTETHELGEEIVASYLYQTFLYDWLDRNGHGRHLADGDL